MTCTRVLMKMYSLPHWTKFSESYFCYNYFFLIQRQSNIFYRIRAGCSLSSPTITEVSGKRYSEASYRSCGKLGNSGKLAGKYPGGGKLSGKLGGKLGGKYGGKLAQVLARRRAYAPTVHSGPPGLAATLASRSRDGTVELQILCQPETQHRARWE